MNGRLRRVTAIALSLMVLAAGCGSDGGGGTTPTTGAPTRTAAPTTAAPTTASPTGTCTYHEQQCPHNTNWPTPLQGVRK